MTANQIIIPIALISLAAFAIYLALKSRRIARETAQRTHRATAPQGGTDKGAIARSAMHGHGTGGSH